ncbi:hypothetical protein EO98_11150 [Methanosarcina sp. 2.H.T.1A.6]|nr:hypothetical protein EO97_15440 [Methanosarcina sp. 2.H.T.1A.15]KKG15529.1 hypothetical protein EO94_11180 [Methanosarcina sp. 2.H.T.1A.3]KKG24164.1 hypothetical protein EO98_11150 [Methanosarcina sp. 2.H.T.1A.6]KKG25634.1 hypothetical protein EO96_19025 [Methanosarcina sp. 2.H.T.1A.8]
MSFLSRSTQENGLSQKERKGRDKGKLKVGKDDCEWKREPNRSNRQKFQSNFSFKSVFLSFWEEPPDKLAEALIFICELK